MFAIKTLQTRHTQEEGHTQTHNRPGYRVTATRTGAHGKYLEDKELSLKKKKESKPNTNTQLYYTALTVQTDPETRV